MKRPHSYHTWMAMRRRCRDKKFNHYSSYGGRGITICEGWFNSFASFIADMGRRPKGESIHRKDNEGGYWCGHCSECKSLRRKANCVWATPKQQAAVQRRKTFSGRLKATNTSGFKGVHWHLRAKKWCANIRVGAKKIHLGLFRSARKAAKCVDEASFRIYGDPARLNFQ